MRKLAVVLLWAAIFMPTEIMAQEVMFNTNSGKYHAPDCKWAEKCTKNCIKTEEAEAVAKGGVPCKVCEGRSDNVFKKTPKKIWTNL